MKSWKISELQYPDLEYLSSPKCQDANIIEHEIIFLRSNVDLAVKFLGLVNFKLGKSLNF